MASSDGVRSSRMDTLLRALSDHRRRDVLDQLRDNGTPQNGGLSVPEDLYAGEQDRDDLAVEMYHHHLPQLEDAELVRWDEEAATVSKGPRFDEVEPLLEHVA